MNDINATIGIENMIDVDYVIEKHQKNSAYYDKNLKDVDGVTLLERDERMQSAAWIYSMLVERKDDFMKKMKEDGIMVSQVHERNDIHSCVSEFRTQLPNLDKITPRLISIPVGWWLKDYEREYIVDKIKVGW